VHHWDIYLLYHTGTELDGRAVMFKELLNWKNTAIFEKFIINWREDRLFKRIRKEIILGKRYIYDGWPDNLRKNNFGR
jgi:hypothetical protein